MSKRPHSSEFYEYCFPDISKATKKDFQYVFSEYGCMEAVNVEFDELQEKFVFEAKKRKPLLVEDHVGDSNRIFQPMQSVMPLGKPTIISKLLKLTTAKDLWHRRLKGETENPDKSELKILASIEDQLENLIIDHPDVAQGTFLDLLAHYFPFKARQGKSCSVGGIELGKEGANDCDSNPANHFLPSVTGVSRGHHFAHGIDPCMFDVPRSLLNDLLLEEFETEIKQFVYDSSYSGGALAYKHIDSRETRDYGMIVRAGGPAMDELSLQLLATDICKEYDDDEAFQPSLHLGSDYRCQINGRIMQTDVQQSFGESSKFYVGTRSMHHVMLTTINTKKIELHSSADGVFEELKWPSERCVEHVGVLQSPQTLTSVAVSPYIDGECAVTNDDGCVYLWKPSLQSDTHLKQANTYGPEIEVIVQEDMSCFDDKWMHVEFASHPRQLLLADRRKVNVVDIRGKSSSIRVLHLPNNPQEADEQVMTVLSGSKFNHSSEFQCLVASTTQLMLMDLRYCKVPLLRWALNMRLPCQHLCSVGCVDNSATYSLNSMILAANQRAQEIHMYQCNIHSKSPNPVFQSSSNHQALHPPVSLAPPYAVDSFKDIRRAIMGYPHRCNGYLNDRLSYPIIGLAGYHYKKDGNDEGIVALQLSACGDLLYQSFELQDPRSAWHENNVVSGPVPKFSKVHKDKIQETRVATEKLWMTWADGVAQQYSDAVKKENPLNLRCTRTTVNSFQFSSRDLLSKLLQNLREKRAEDCIMCEDLLRSDDDTDIEDTEILNKLRALHQRNKPVGSPSCYSQNNEALNAEKKTDLCSSCHTRKNFTKSLLKNRQNGIFHPANKDWLGDDDLLNTTNDDVVCDVTDVPPLKLVTPTCAQTGLGRVLLSTWDRPYEELWDSFKSHFVEEQRKDKELSEQRVFDIRKIYTEEKSTTNSRKNICKATDFSDLSSTSSSEDDVSATRKPSSSIQRSTDNHAIACDSDKNSPIVEVNLAVDSFSSNLLEKLTENGRISNEGDSSNRSDITKKKHKKKKKLKRSKEKATKSKHSASSPLNKRTLISNIHETSTLNESVEDVSEKTIAITPTNDCEDESQTPQSSVKITKLTPRKLITPIRDKHDVSVVSRPRQSLSTPMNFLSTTPKTSQSTQSSGVSRVNKSRPHKQLKRNLTGFL